MKPSPCAASPAHNTPSASFPFNPLIHVPANVPASMTGKMGKIQAGVIFPIVSLLSRLTVNKGKAQGDSYRGEEEEDHIEKK
ncbi:uncharacterized protein CTHT_0020500 [Thermochaetoides thermophila DSM 1495]|uniref:Uncharacterized protein n=1 Tax=Chaetomium thermophilum (strain DSM 1495 / CBS 144.50 / IMI 039719) TaxID=759272 RepID=G0S3C3_CHATD|nr:hypothetical protein CTHT_0020500 [Thermochaetoides thermophila DSM 1495]EGS22506.1 hypothetical protein CTHT_0020500 [Thermochaetoides thermophila DSM 1495]